MAEFKHIVRVANTDLDGKKEILFALRKIKGVSVMFGNMTLSLSGIDRHKKAGDLLDAEVTRLNDVVTNPIKHGAPEWMLNRRNDYETGENMHLLMADLTFSKETDIKRMKKTKSYKGLRHQWGLPVRGQRTQGNFRRHKGKGLGVKRKK